MFWQIMLLLTPREWDYWGLKKEFLVFTLCSSSMSEWFTTSNLYNWKQIKNKNKQNYPPHTSDRGGRKTG